MAKKRQRKFETEETSGCPDLLELSFYIPQGASDTDFQLGAEVRFGTMVVSSNDWHSSIEFGLTKAHLRLHLEGCKIQPKSRLSDHQQPGIKTNVRARSSETSKSSAIARGSASLALRTAPSPASAAARIEGGGAKSKASEATSSINQSYSKVTEPVTALPGQRWQFSAIGHHFLQSKYAGDEALCAVQCLDDDVRIAGALSFYPKDIFIVDTQDEARSVFDRFKKSPNRTAIAQVLLSKHLKQMNELPSRNTGEINGAIAAVKSNLDGE